MNTRRSLGSISTVLAALTLVTATAYAADVTGTAGDDHLDRHRECRHAPRPRGR